MNYWLIPTLLLALALFKVGILAARRSARDVTYILFASFGLVASVPAVVFSVYYFRVLNEPIWLYEFRSLPCTELAASGAGFMAGLLHGRYAFAPRFSRLAGRWFFLGVLVLGLLIPYAKPILRPPQWSQFQDRWADGVCLQTSESSCGPACAATLLRQLGRSATEQEIAQESFTCRSGTENWYLARSLRRRGIKVKFLFSAGQGWPIPSIAGVRLSNLENSGHFITMLGHEGDNYIIGDPLEGRLVLSQSTLESNYAFTGFFLQLE
jgi:predicted double-glycine peptidase